MKSLYAEFLVAIDRVQLGDSGPLDEWLTTAASDLLVPSAALREYLRVDDPYQSLVFYSTAKRLLGDLLDVVEHVRSCGLADRDLRTNRQSVALAKKLLIARLLRDRHPRPMTARQVADHLECPLLPTTWTLSRCDWFDRCGHANGYLLSATGRSELKRHTDDDEQHDGADFGVEETAEKT